MNADVSLVSTQQAKTTVQFAFNIVIKWSKEYKLVINGIKSKSSCFTFANELWCPNISINNQVVRHEPHPKLLGVTLDGTLTFGKHVKRISARAS